MGKTNFIFIGAGGHARVLASAIESIDGELVAVFDQDPLKKHLDGVVNLGNYGGNIYSHAKVLIAIGDNLIRKKISANILHEFGQVVHAAAQVDRLAQLSKGVQVMSGAIINRGAQIGNHTIINSNATVEHDCKIDDFVHIAPGATICGGVEVGEATLIGANATVLPRCIIGQNVTIGAGAVVISNIPDNVTVAGVPSKIISDG